LGVDLQLDVLIACIIGGGSLLGGKGDMWGAFFGTAFVTLLQNGFNLFEINPLLKSVVIGGILVLVVAVDGYIYLKKMRALGKA
jgi:ribose/xylose/arabinose/galactoside ABC-type transport system permease subunit